jgi:BirA family transcriptional regulator, biotin operon repressor / biotin---[acetyl-CoA-carboxylase] ligase
LSKLATDAVRLDIVHVAQTGSTNADAMGLALGGRPTPFWVQADIQTAGKGRSGRTWVSLPGNLHASCVIKTRCDLRHAGQLALVAGVALAEAVQSLAADDGKALPPDFRLKWPNDLMVGAAKCAGILVESSREPQTGELVAVIGFGVNVVAHAKDLEREATNLAAHGLTIEPSQLLCALDGALHTQLDRWDDGAGFDCVRSAWLAAASAVGTPMVVHVAATRTIGRFAGLDNEGALLLTEDDGALRTIFFGDVTL